MPVAQSVVGYFPDSVVKDLQQGSLRQEIVELPLEPGGHSQLRVRRSDIDEVRLGPSAKGHTSVQVVLKTGASYEFVSVAPSDEQLLTPIRDPAFWYGPWRPGPIVIYIGPIYKQQQLGVFKQV